jgi:membrane protein YqaA with SNARE-associated domain
MIDSLVIWLVSTFGYVGVFVSSLIGSATILLPVPSFLIVIAAGTSLNPFLVGLIAGIAAAIGELVGYGIGRGVVYGRDKLVKRKKDRPLYKKIRNWFNSGYGPLVIFIFAATPLPDDVVGLICGAMKYDIKKFFIATLVGKIILYLALAYAGFYGIGFLANLLNL